MISLSEQMVASEPACERACARAVRVCAYDSTCVCVRCRGLFCGLGMGGPASPFLWMPGYDTIVWALAQAAAVEPPALSNVSTWIDAAATMC